VHCRLASQQAIYTFAVFLAVLSAVWLLLGAAGWFVLLVTATAGKNIEMYLTGRRCTLLKSRGRYNHLVGNALLIAATALREQCGGPGLCICQCVQQRALRC
jgi:hypothetical protein